MSAEIITVTTNKLIIYGAAYGPVDVTGAVRNMRKNQSLSVLADPSTFNISDPWPKVRKTLIIVYKYTSQTAVQLQSTTDFNTITINPPSGSQDENTSGPQLVDHLDSSSLSTIGDITSRNLGTGTSLTILGAAYGVKNVTQQANTLLTVQGEFNQEASDAIWGTNVQPIGYDKTLVVVYEYNGYVMQHIVKESESMHFIASPPLTILGAAYGLLDVQCVTDKVRQTVRNAALSIRADDATFTNGWPDHTKSLVVVYQYGEETPQVAIAQENEQLQLIYSPSNSYSSSADPQNLTILGAAYGLGNVTETVQSLVTDNKTLNVTANNQTFHDHWYGTVKTLVVVYSYGHNLPKIKVVQEHHELTINPSSPPPIHTGLMDTTGLFHNNDLLAIRAFNNKYVKINSSNQLVATEDSLSDECQLTLKIPASQGSGFNILANNSKYITVGSDNVLYADSVTEAGAANFFALIGRQGELRIATASGMYVRLTNNSSDTLAADSVDYISANTIFDISFKMSATHTNDIMMSHIGESSNQISGLSSCDLAKARLLWSVTGGFFQAIGLGPFISTGRVQTGVFIAVTKNPRAWAAFTQFATRLPLEEQNRKGIISDALRFIGVLHSEGLLWTIFKVMLKVGFWMGVVWCLAQIIKFALLPEGEAAQLLASFIAWAIQLIQAGLAVAQACN